MPRSAAVVLLPAAAVAPVALPNGSLEDGAGALPTCWTGRLRREHRDVHPRARCPHRRARRADRHDRLDERRPQAHHDDGHGDLRAAGRVRTALRAARELPLGERAAPARLLPHGRGRLGLLGKSAATPHGGAWSETLSVTSITSGDRKVLSSFDPACAPPAIPGHPYLAGAWYRSDAPVRVVLYYRDAAGAWRFWAKSAPRPASAAWAPATLRSQPAPPGATALATGLLLDTPGTASVDDLSLADMG